MMFFFKQFKLLLIQRLILRKRQPIIFGLELFWPAIVFLAIFIIRFNFLPSFKNTCTYSSKALPSTGPINFLQSFVCTLDNPCLNETHNEETTKFPGARIHSIVDHLKPLFNNKRSIVEKLPKGIYMIESIVKTLSDTTLRNFLENGLPMKDILHDESSLQNLKLYIKTNLKNSTKISEKQMENAIQTLVFSSLNVIQLAQTFKNNNFNYTQEDYACDLNAFKKLLLVRDESHSEIISNFDQENDTIDVLCELSNLGYLDELLQLTQRSIDLVKVLHWLRTLLHILGLHEQQNHLNNVMYMLTTVQKRDMLSPSHKWNISDDLQDRIISLVEHVDHSKNGFVISLEKLTQEHTLNSLIQTIEHIKLESKLNPDHQLEQALESITIGLHSLKYFKEQGLFKVQYKFYELIKNVDSVKLFMELQLQLEPSLIDLIMSSTFDFTETVASNNIDQNLLCNRNTLQKIINFNDSQLKNGYDSATVFELTSGVICTLSTNDNYYFTQKIIRTYAIKKIGTNILDLISSGVLKNSNISHSDVPDALVGLKILSSSMHLVKEFIHQFTKILDLGDHISNLNLQGDGVDVLSSPQTANITGKIMCGKDLPAISNEFHLLKVNVIEKKNVDKIELINLKSDFCKNGYLQIMKMQGGSLIWTWLKPILSGKILFSPRNQFTNLIIKEINNTFTSMEEIIMTLKAWTQTAQSLQHFYSNKNITQRLQQIGDFIPLVLDEGFEMLSKDTETINLIENLSKSGGIIGLIELFGNIAQCFEMNRFIGFDNEYSLEQAAKLHSKSYDLIAGIVFINSTASSDLDVEKRINYENFIPKKVNYKLRFDLDFVPGTKMLKDRIWEPGAKDHFSNDLGYFKGFVQLQELIDRAIMHVQLKQAQYKKSLKLNFYNSNLNTSLLEFERNYHLLNNYLNDFSFYNPSIYMQQIPYACYKEDKFGFYILALSPVISTVAWIFLIAFSIRDYVLERELHLEEILYVTGLKPSVRWLIWFLFAFIILAFGCACGLFIFYLADIIPNSNFLLVYIYFLAFCFSIVMYCYMMSSFFKTATIASLSGIIIYLASFLPFMVAITLEHELKLSSKLISCLSMSTSFCFGIMYLARFESQGVGIQWNNIWQSPMAEDTMNFAYAGILMIIDGFVYFVIGWYVSNVFAINNYAKKPFYFFLLPSYWKFCLFSSKSSTRKYKEKITLSKHRGIAIHNLSVIYNQNDKQKKHHAVSNLTMSLEEGKIATLLGKNGAGKTTTINVLTGILKPTSGSVYVYGQEFLTNFEEARKLLGYCPQYNVLFDRLTVREHLEFFAKLKNLLKNEHIKNDVDHMLKSTGLFDLQNELAKNLSGGLQRRLCVALAFIGGSKLIILDEPTASVDPVARRQIWDLIVSQKSTRTVLLTTHHMDEADILSDSVAVIHKGQLLCFGSPLLLKSKFGCGYQLTISRQGSSNLKSNSKYSNKMKNSIYNEYQMINNAEFEDNIHEDFEETVLDNLNITDSDSGRVSNNSLNLINSESNYKNFNEKFDLISSSEKLMQFIRCLIPNALKLDENLNEIIVALPRCGIDGQAHDYCTFFQCLDSNISRFGYFSYGLTSTTLEEVFLTLCNLQETKFDFYGNLESKLNLAKKLNLTLNSYYNQKHDQTFQAQHLEGNFSLCDEFDIVQKTKFKKSQTYTGFSLKYMQFKGLMKKRAYHTFTNWRTLFYNLIFPCIFIAFAMGMTLIKPNLAPDPILPLSPSIYGSEATSFFAFRKTMLENNLNEIDNYNLFENTVSNQLFDIDYSKSLHGYIRELDCAKPRNGWKVSKCPVVKKNFETEFPSYLLNFSANKTMKNLFLNQKCSCEDCHNFDYLGNLDTPKLTNVGYVYNVSNVNNINYFLMKTFSLFNDRRYGGWSVHQVIDDHELSSLNKNFPDSKNIWKIWFDNNGIHAIPSYLNALNNALLRANLIESVGLSNAQAREYSINAYSHPFHIRSAQLGDQNLMQKAGDAGIGLIILVGFVFIPTSFVFYIVKERVNEEKHMQRIFGVGTILYWTSAIIWDMLIVLFSVLIAGAIIWSFQMPIYTTRLNFPAIMLLLLLFGWAMISLVYLLEKFFDEASIAFMVIYCLTLFVGINTMVFRLLIDVFKLLQVSSTFKITFERIALVFPPFALMSGLVDVTKNHLLSEMFMLINQDVYINPFSMNLLAPHYITLAVEGVVLFILNLIIELIKNNDFWFLNDCCFLSCFWECKHQQRSKLSSTELLDALDQEENPYDTIFDNEDLGHYSKIPYNKKSQKNFSVKINDCLENTIRQTSEDQDVYEERKRIIMSELQMNQLQLNENWYKFYDNSFNKDILKVVNVSKCYKSVNNSSKLAVNKVSFGVPRGECFGLLGTNGAGKTTLFKTLTGQIHPTSGTTLFNQQKVDKVLAGTCKILGYCPQTDALDSTLTPKQHLSIYATIRGIKNNIKDQVIKESLYNFQLNQYENFTVQSLSRGTKRKLCLAIAMLGDPQIVLLDEPTSGMDPMSRRCLWKNIQTVIKEKRSVLMTSHSMEECDILCSRIAIMMNGKFSCLGSPQYLKRKFGYGYTITLKLNECFTNYAKAISFIKQRFPSILLRAHHHNMLEFSLPTNNIALSKIFSNLDKAKEALALQEYSVSQTTLDQVFVNFASQDDSELTENNVQSNSIENHLMHLNVKPTCKQNFYKLTNKRNEKSFDKEFTKENIYVNKSCWSDCTLSKKSKFQLNQAAKLKPGQIKVKQQTENYLTLQNTIKKLNYPQKSFKNQKKSLNQNKFRNSQFDANNLYNTINNSISIIQTQPPQFYQYNVSKKSFKN